MDGVAHSFPCGAHGAGRGLVLRFATQTFRDVLLSGVPFSFHPRSGQLWRQGPDDRRDHRQHQRPLWHHRRCDRARCVISPRCLRTTGGAIRAEDGIGASYTSPRAASRSAGAGRASRGKPRPRLRLEPRAAELLVPDACEARRRLGAASGRVFVCLVRCVATRPFAVRVAPVACEVVTRLVSRCFFDHSCWGCPTMPFRSLCCRRSLFSLPTGWRKSPAYARISGNVSSPTLKAALAIGSVAGFLVAYQDSSARLMGFAPNEDEVRAARL